MQKSHGVAWAGGVEWIVEAYGCDPIRLRSQQHLERLFAAVIADLDLRPVTGPTWHVFPPPGGLTGFLVLQESHLACHTFPEHGLATLNLFCCTPRVEWPWGERLGDHLGAGHVSVRAVDRGIEATRVSTVRGR